MTRVTSAHLDRTSCGDIVMAKTTRFDAAHYLDSKERQVAYITAALECGDADFVRDALGIVARARGMRRTTSCRKGE
jgi:probable addiction module antidote protein